MEGVTFLKTVSYSVATGIHSSVLLYAEQMSASCLYGLPIEGDRHGTHSLMGGWNMRL